jgi:hypothetical protein
MNAPCQTSNGSETVLSGLAAASEVNSSTYGGGTSSSSDAPAAGTKALQ